MKPAAFDYVRARSLAEATRLLIEHDGDARLVAGAQSLGPMLNLRLAQPRLLIDITGIPELTRIDARADAVTVGSCVTTANIEDGRVPGGGIDILRAVAGGIAYRAVRNRGTIGGSLCHADPAADWPTILAALGAECLISGADGKRCLSVDQFITGAYETALAPGEILEAVTIRRLSGPARCGYVKICRKAGEFGLATAGVLNDPERSSLRTVIGATNGRPIVIADLRTLQRADATLDDAAIIQTLRQHGISERVTRRQMLTAVTRAYQQARLS